MAPASPHSLASGYFSNIKILRELCRKTFKSWCKKSYWIIIPFPNKCLNEKCKLMCHFFAWLHYWVQGTNPNRNTTLTSNIYPTILASQWCYAVLVFEPSEVPCLYFVLSHQYQITFLNIFKLQCSQSLHTSQVKHAFHIRAS